ncbi:MAG: hypothetical protein IJI08_09820 [Clostridia bacterium]|nr:hypothetical protein [Clostridia bacterium]
MEYRNPEHYPDPTAGKAIENIEQEEERMKRQRRWGGRKHRRDGAHRMEMAGSPLPALKRGRLQMGSVTQIEDLDASSWKPRPGLQFRLVWEAKKTDEEESRDE